MATDDDIILESPYGAGVSLFSDSDRLSYNSNNTFTLVISDSDIGKLGLFISHVANIILNVLQY